MPNKGVPVRYRNVLRCLAWVLSFRICRTQFLHIANNPCGQRVRDRIVSAVDRVPYHLCASPSLGDATALGGVGTESAGHDLVPGGA